MRLEHTPRRKKVKPRINYDIVNSIISLQRRTQAIAAQTLSIFFAGKAIKSISLFTDLNGKESVFVVL